jgi:hypothetical protein
VGSFSPFRLNHVHSGNSFLALQSRVENRIDVVSNFRVTRFRYAFLQGIDSSRREQSAFFQALSRFLAKRLYSKTAGYETFGSIHSSVASTAFSHLGIGNKVAVKSDVKSNQTVPSNVFFTVNSPQVYKKNFVENLFPAKSVNVAFSTHNNQSAPSFDYLLPITSLYERSGHFRILEGTVRKHHKATSSVGIISQRRNRSKRFLS